MAYFSQIIFYLQIKNELDNRCIDAMDVEIGTQPIMYTCHNNGGNQFSAFTEDGLIVTCEENRCFGVTKNEKDASILKIVECSDTDKSQRWQYNIKVRMLLSIFILIEITSENQ